MHLRDFMLAHRDEILAACKAELGNGRTLDQVVLDMQANFLEVTHAALESAGVERPDPAALVGESPAAAAVRTRIDQLSSRSRAPVLICGEAGVGKRHCARALHRATYPNGFWFELDDTNLPDLERHLLAIRKSTSVEAEVGTTIYVHRLPEAQVAMQARLLTLLNEQWLPFRVIVSSTRPLALAVRDNSLPSSFAFRFANELKLLPLCERQEDIAPLVGHFAALFGAQTGGGRTTFSPEALAALTDYSWPGNTAELAGLIERLVTDCGAVRIELGDLPLLGDRPSGAVLTLSASGIDFAELERQLLVQALALAGNNQTRAGALLGLTRDQIRYRMAKFDLWTVGARGG